MKTFLKALLAAALLASATFAAGAAERSYPASDTRVTWVGRTLVRDGAVSFDWSATYARFSFSGDYLALKASDTRKNYFNVWIDRPMSAEPDKVVAVEGEDCTVVLADADLFKAMYGRKRPQSHTVIIQKRTEGDQGVTTVREIVCDGDLLQAEGLRARQIEFVGDSYTCGYGAENSVSSNRFTPETESSSKSYAAIVTRYFGADYVSISHSGQGIVRNYGGNGRDINMVNRYGRTFDNDKDTAWDASKSAFDPDITVIYLGTNDFSTNLQPMYNAFRRNYLNLLGQIKANYGEDHPILCVASKADEGLFDYVRDIVNSCGLKNVTYYGFFNGVHYDDDRELGADWHPNYLAHKKIAYAIIPYIATAAGWDLEDRTVE